MIAIPLLLLAASAGAPSYDPTAASRRDLATPARSLVAGTDTRGPQTFCAIGLGDPADDVVWVHWVERGRLILWENAVDPRDRRDSLVRSRRNLSLADDVVERDEDVASSTYLVTRAWADDVIARCRAHGRTMRVLPLRRAR